MSSIRHLTLNLEWSDLKDKDIKNIGVTIASMENLQELNLNLWGNKIENSGVECILS